MNAVGDVTSLPKQAHPCDAVGKFNVIAQEPLMPEVKVPAAIRKTGFAPPANVELEHPVAVKLAAAGMAGASAVPLRVGVPVKAGELKVPPVTAGVVIVGEVSVPPLIVGAVIAGALCTPPVMVGLLSAGAVSVPPVTSNFDIHALVHCAAVHTCPVVIVPPLGTL